jgi:murein DD-endopeptidase MepM/ murein hydrolase activator NlpD
MKNKIIALIGILVLLMSGCAHAQYATAEALPEYQWWCYPLPGAKVISPYGQRGGRQHTGADLKTKNKDKIYAAFAGEVVFADKFSGYGNLIRIRHANGLETYYAHNSKNLVKKGQRVKAGQVIALVGQTGRATTPHLHFETRVDGKPRNPANYFDLDRGVIRK